MFPGLRYDCPVHIDRERPADILPASGKTGRADEQVAVQRVSRGGFDCSQLFFSFVIMDSAWTENRRGSEPVRATISSCA